MTDELRKSKTQQRLRFKRGSIRLNDRVAKRLSGYVSAARGAVRDALAQPISNYLVAGVAGVGVLAVAAPANADILPGNGLSFGFSPPCCNGGSSLNGQWDIAGSAVDFWVNATGTNVAASVWGAPRFALARVRGGIGANAGAGVLGPLAIGYKVGPGDKFGSGIGYAFASYFWSGLKNAPPSCQSLAPWDCQFYSRRASSGSWANQRGYIGFRIPIDGQSHYGWAFLSVGVSGSAYSAEVSDVHYNSAPNETIRVGQTQAIPEPGTLGLLALGSLGLGLWRRKKQGTGVTDNRRVG